MLRYNLNVYTHYVTYVYVVQLDWIGFVWVKKNWLTCPSFIRLHRLYTIAAPDLIDSSCLGSSFLTDMTCAMVSCPCTTHIVQYKCGRGLGPTSKSMAGYARFMFACSSSSSIIVRPLSRIMTMGGVHIAQTELRLECGDGIRVDAGFRKRVPLRYCSIIRITE